MNDIALPSPEPLDTSTMAGKTFGFVAMGTNDIFPGIADGATEALESVGAELKYVESESSPDSAAQALRTMVNQGVSAILMGAYESDLVKSAAIEAEQAGIPLISTLTGSTEPVLANGQVGTVNSSAKDTGKAQADYALAKTNCELNGIMVFTSVGVTTALHNDGFKEEVAELCPDCKVESIDVDNSNPSSVVGQISTAIQRDPSINALMASWDGWVPFEVQAAKAVGYDLVKENPSDQELMILGAVGSDSTVEFAMQNGVAMSTLPPPSELVGWYSADALMRAVSGATPPITYAFSEKIVDDSNWGSAPLDPSVYPTLPDYQEVFKTAWGQ
ncbi:MAG TPA: substrate-binding domain-containing protein [Nocardioides sp.]|uniref:sugar ABC transporter substrate-binding protein n=1 Tax=uncultured Nocardioides sp. TaxID=198441 RepID=UPI002605FC28|nr:substrate-binding domain-containing protein [uncultured Nocardioides sp.]HRI94035.1 substrate-binding domain-containing protein [Nocardioides sp.]HRK44057.1 substrate-binding domain-containing protein [Nocardioides sp.]